MATMRVGPGRVLIQREEPELMAAGGKLHLPERDAQRPLWGRVLAVGPAPRCTCGGAVDVQVSVGDRVLHDRYAGTEVVLDGALCLVLGYGDVLGVLED